MGKEQVNKTTRKNPNDLLIVKNVDTNETFSEGTSYRAALDKFLVKDLNPNGATKA